MSLKETYKEHILNKLIKEYLYNGVIPTSDNLEDDLSSYMEVHKDLSLPQTKYYDFSINRGEQSSSSLNNEIVDLFKDDLSVLTNEIYRLALNDCSYYERWSKELSRLDRKASALNNRINGLLLLTNNTSGYFNFVGDVFSDVSLVDTENSTAFIDTESQVVTIKSGTQYLSSQKQIDLSYLSNKDITFSVVSQRTGTSMTTLSGSLENLVSYDSSKYLCKVNTTVNGRLVTDLKLSFNKDIEISKASILSSSPYSNSSDTISMQYSLDGYNWFLVPCSDSTQSYNKKNLFIFSPIKTRFIKFIISKFSADTEKKEYYFSFDSIKLFNTSFYNSLGNEFYSSPLYNTKDNLVSSFLQAQLEVCEEVPSDTSIEYYLSASIDNINWTNWYRVSTKVNDSFPNIVNFSGAIQKDNNANSSVIDSSYNSSKLAESITDNTVDSYNFVSSDFKFINQKISLLNEDDTEIVSNSIEVWRNIYSLSDRIVRSIPAGWSLSGSTYSCYFYIEDSNGIYLNFGDTKCVIDGVSITGAKLIAKGIHKFQTESSNWANINSSLISSIKSEAELSVVDPLYPYNHKYLINGISYPSSFIGEKIYIGADISAESYLSKTSLFDLENNKVGFDYFSIRQINKDTENPALGLIVKIDSSINDFQNERFFVRWRSNDNIDSYKYIKLKALLLTEDPNLTPKLSGYRIKLG